MNREHLKDILLWQDKKEPGKERFIKRELSDEVAEYNKTSFIIIISGIRRCGKSTLLNQMRSKDSYYVNFDDERFINFSVDDFQQMYEVLIELFGEKDILF